MTFSKFRYALLLLVIAVKGVYSQAVPQGFNYQATVRDLFGNQVAGQPVNFLFTFYSGSPSGTLEWQESTIVLTDDAGHAKTIIGQGTGTGVGAVSSFAQVNWSARSYYLKVSVDITGGNSFSDLGVAELFSVPYAFHAAASGTITNLSLSQYADTDMSGLAPGKLLKWNGSFWYPAVDLHSDTILFAYNTSHAHAADTANYVFSSTVDDSVMFTYQSGAAVYAGSSAQATTANAAAQADTAMYALASAPYAWMRTGNNVAAQSSYLGTNDANDLVFKTNNNEAFSVKSTGSIAAGNPPVMAGLSAKGSDGFLSTGTFGSGTASSLGAGTRMMWYPLKASFRAGTATGTEWDDANIGPYSFAAGYNTQAADYGFAAGNGSVAGGYYGIAMGRKSSATGLGVYPAGAAVAIGDSSNALALRSVSIGRGNLSSMTTAASLGVNNKATGSISLAIGYNCLANAAYSAAIGYYASTNAKVGSFVYADASAAAVTNSTVNNQFMVRASGGTVFYTDAAMTMGVSLAAGSGSWSAVSDVHKKENFQPVNDELILTQVTELKILSWSYKAQSRRIRHIGPMAQDFYRIFNVGEAPVTISSVDMDGVIIAGIRALNFRINALTGFNELDALKQKTAMLDNAEELNKRLDEIERNLKNKTQ